MLLLLHESLRCGSIGDIHRGRTSSPVSYARRIVLSLYKGAYLQGRMSVEALSWLNITMTAKDPLPGQSLISFAGM